MSPHDCEKATEARLRNGPVGAGIILVSFGSDIEGGSMPTKYRALVGAVSSLALLALAAAMLAPVAGTASSHREAPLTAADPQIDNTDLWAFVSPDAPNKVNLISSWIPMEEPAGGPNFYQFAEHTNYDIKIDSDGDSKPNIVYRWKFQTHYRDPGTFLYNTGVVTSLRDPDLNIYQTYDLYRFRGGKRVQLLNDAKVAPSNVGRASMPNYNKDLFDAAVTPVMDEGSSWVGQSDDPFFLDLRIFDLAFGGDLSEVGDDTFAGFNVNTIALQVSKRFVRMPGDGDVIGIWSTVSRPTTRVQTPSGDLHYQGGDVQVSRLGMPFTNEVVVPVGSKDYFNASKPFNDAQFLPLVNHPILPPVLHQIYGTEIPDSDPNKPGIQRDDLIQVFLTGVPGLNKPAHVQASEMLRLNMAIPPCTDACSRLGVLGGDLAGFPNGRRLSDDVTDASLRVVLGALLPDHQHIADTIGDQVNGNDVPFLDEFPYVAYPHSGSTPDPHGN